MKSENQWTLRQMQEADIGQVVSLEEEIFFSPWSEKSFRDALHREDTIYLVAEGEGEISGYLGIWLSFDTADLCNMAVAYECRRRHLGQQLLQEGLRLAAEKGAAQVLLEVRESNEAAIGLYQRNGFQEIGRRRGYYSRPTEDALLMRCLVTCHV